MKKAASNLLLLLSLLYFAVLLAWYICYSNGFYYSFAYVAADLGSTISERAKSDTGYAAFASAGGGQHLNLFSSLVKCVENGGKGFDALKYTSDGVSYRFLNSAETERLVLTSEMLSMMKKMFRLAVLFTLLICVYMITAKIKPYSWRITARVMSYVFSGFVLILYLYGFDRVFGLFHRILFGSQYVRNADGLLSLLIPYPGMYMFLWGTFLMTALGCLGVLYIFCGYFVKRLGDKMNP